MKDIMAFYARSNRTINRLMNDILQKNIPDPYNLELDSYYFRNLSELLDHTFSTDMIWMKSFFDTESCGLNLTQEMGPVPSYGEKVFENYNEYLMGRTKLDDLIERYMSSLDDDMCLKIVFRVTKTGKKIEKVAYKAMIHFFNHQTHHRGQISNILDSMNIENDFSNMIFLD